MLRYDMLMLCFVFCVVLQYAECRALLVADPWDSLRFSIPTSCFNFNYGTIPRISKTGGVGAPGGAAEGALGAGRRGDPLLRPVLFGNAYAKKPAYQHHITTTPYLPNHSTTTAHMPHNVTT